MYGIVYVARCKVTGKCYVGQTVQELKVRRWAHEQAAFSMDRARHLPFYRAMRKYGIRSFTWKILQRCRDRYTLAAAEEKWIKELHTFGGLGYNAAPGGLTTRLSGKLNGMYGKKLSKKHRAKISRSLIEGIKVGRIKILKGNKTSGWRRRHSREEIEKQKATIMARGGYPATGTHLSKARRLQCASKGKDHPLYGVGHSKKSRKKMSESVSGKNHRLYGKHHSPATIRKMRAAHRKPRFHGRKDYESGYAYKLAREAWLKHLKRKGII